MTVHFNVDTWNPDDDEPDQPAPPLEALLDLPPDDLSRAAARFADQLGLAERARLLVSRAADLPDDLVARWLPRLWTDDDPALLKVLSRGEMITTWRRLGFVRHYRQAARPTKALTLFRGATAAWARGAAWTTDPLVAASFAAVRARVRPAWRVRDLAGRIWITEAEPDALLAVIDSRDGEVIVDPYELGEVRALTRAEVADFGRLNWREVTDRNTGQSGYRLFATGGAVHGQRSGNAVRNRG